MHVEDVFVKIADTMAEWNIPFELAFETLLKNNQISQEAAALTLLFNDIITIQDEQKVSFQQAVSQYYSDYSRINVTLQQTTFAWMYLVRTRWQNKFNTSLCAQIHDDSRIPKVERTANYSIAEWLELLLKKEAEPELTRGEILAEIKKNFSEDGISVVIESRNSSLISVAKLNSEVDRLCEHVKIAGVSLANNLSYNNPEGHYDKIEIYFNEDVRENEYVLNQLVKTYNALNEY